jgi:nucleoid-associated protein YgaU
VTKSFSALVAASEELGVAGIVTLGAVVAVVLVAELPASRAISRSKASLCAVRAVSTAFTPLTAGKAFEIAAARATSALVAASSAINGSTAVAAGAVLHALAVTPTVPMAALTASTPNADRRFIP